MSRNKKDKWAVRVVWALAALCIISCQQFLKKAKPVAYSFSSPSRRFLVLDLIVFATDSNLIPFVSEKVSFHS